MCEHCLVLAQRWFATLTDEQKKMAILATRTQHGKDEFERGVKSGEDYEIERNAEAYRRKVVPRREALLAAVKDAETSLTGTNEQMIDILRRFIANVKRDADAIPSKL